MSNAQDVEKIMGELHRLYPLPFPVRVHRTLHPKSPEYGICELTPKGEFLITIRWTLSYLETELVLIHEWAHAASWWHEHNGDHDPDVWGREYAKVYCAYYETT